MKKRILLVLATILILILVGSTAVAAEGATVPFRAAFQTFPVETGYADGILTMDIPGEGWATHMGSSTLESTSYIHIPSFDDPPPYRQETYGAIIAANGDRLSLAMEGEVVPGAGKGTWETTDDSTGHFAGVTGTGKYWYKYDGEEWHLLFKGTLSK